MCSASKNYKDQQLGYLLKGAQKNCEVIRARPKLLKQSYKLGTGVNKKTQGNLSIAGRVEIGQRYLYLSGRHTIQR